MKLHATICLMLLFIIRYYPAFVGMILFTILLQAKAVDMYSADIMFVSSDSHAFLRISCMDGNSLFISLAVPAGHISPDTLTEPSAAGTHWITGGPVGQSVNIVYAAAPRVLLRYMLAGHSGKLTFSGGGPAFDTRILDAWYQRLPAACG